MSDSNAGAAHNVPAPNPRGAEPPHLHGKRDAHDRRHRRIGAGDTDRRLAAAAEERAGAPLSAEELDALQKATSKPVKLTFTLKNKDAYLPEEAAAEYAWGIKIDLEKFLRDRRHLRRTGPNGDLSYRAGEHGLRRL